ncbi:MAG: SDR family oxidoreductase [Candidatus Nanopelagicales bacterium]|nr:SDR family oxidoreductase [Candidatus Nanopelagicales bacterium]
MRIVVTGALGHIGSELIRNPTLIDACHEIVLIDDLSTHKFGSLFNLPPGVKYTLLQGDVAQELSVTLSESVDAVIHLAGITDPLASVSNPNWLFDNNLRITKHIADTCEATKTPLVFVSTTSVYTSTDATVDERCSDLVPTSPYALCKLQEEAYVLDATRETKSAVFRLGTIFGASPGMRFHTAVNKFCWQAACGQPIEVWSTAMDQLRPYLALEDATAALSKTVLEHIYPGEIVNAVTCNATVRDVLTAISEFGCTTDVRMVDSPVMNNLSFRTSVEKAKSLGFSFEGNLQREVFNTLKLLRGLMVLRD